MGKVFTWAEVSDRKVPEIASFDEVARHIRANLVAEPSIVAATLCGSILYGACTRRSDIDCVVIYYHAQKVAMTRALREITKFASTRHVPVEWIPVSDIVAGNGIHPFGRSFLEHLRLSAQHGGVVKNDLVALLAYSVNDASRGDDALEYLRHKLQKAEKLRLAHPDDLPEHAVCEAIKEALDTPIHAARKVLLCPSVTLSIDRKETVVEEIAKRTHPDVVAYLRRVVAADAGYCEELERQLSTPDRIAYMEKLKEMWTLVAELPEFFTDVWAQFSP